MAPLVHRIDRYEHRRVADRRGGDAADRRLGVAVMMDVGIVEHDLPPPAQQAAVVGLAFYKHVDQPAAEILGAWPFGQFVSSTPDEQDATAE